jgi:PAS domain S-box-containing protein
VKSLLAAQTHLRVLLVEDNATDTLLVRDELEHAAAPFDLETCTHLESALNWLRSQTFDVVLLDLSLPDSDGLATFTALHAAAYGVPIVVLSHLEDEALALQAVREGAQDCLVKGQTKGQLVRAVRYAVVRARLERARQAAEAQLRLLQASVDHINDVVLITNANPTHPCIVYVNDAFTRQTGYTAQEALGRTPSFLQGPKTQRDALDRIAHALALGEPVRVEVINYNKAGQEFWLEIDISALRDTDGVITHFVAIERDIGQRKTFDAAQQEHEKRLELALSGGRLGYWDWNVQDDSLTVGARWLEMLGLDPATTQGSMDLWRSLVHAEDVPKLQHIITTVLDNPQDTTFEVTIRARHAQGHNIWILDKGAVFERLPDGRPLRVVGTHMDITQQKEAELQIAVAVRALEGSQRQLQTLSRRILSAQETERRRVALELHDDLGQALTAVKINLMSPPSVQGRDPTAMEAENIRIIETALQQVRRIALALRPSMLDDLGLEAALKWLVQSATTNRDLVIDLQCRMASDRIAPEIETACFRIVQESLTNIRRHAHAKRVEIALRTDADCLDLTVKDDGVGFDLTTQASRCGEDFSLGLLGIRERAFNVGADISIETSPGQGCTVRLRCSLDAGPFSIL